MSETQGRGLGGEAPGGGQQSQGSPGDPLRPVVSPVSGWVLVGLAFQVIFSQSSFLCPGVV